MGLRDKLTRDPVALDVASAGYRYLQGEELTDEEVEKWREAARKLGEKYPSLKQADPAELE